MPFKIGFAIVSHKHPEQLLRLVNTLNAMFDAPPIACNHNFSMCPLQPEVFPSNVRFVIPHVNARWGHISIPLAALSALRLLRQYGQPDWFILLSGSDYPVRPAHEILHDLSTTEYDAFLDHREVRLNALALAGPVVQHGYERPEWVGEADRRYCAYCFSLPWPSPKRLLSGCLPFWEKRVPIRHPGLIRVIERLQPRLTVCRPPKIFAGDFWFEANQKAINRLLDPSLEKLVRFYERKVIPDESIFHTALCNHTALKICTDNKRYADWTGGGSHPKWLDLSDVPKIIASGAHFARKFLPGGRVQEYIDKKLLQL
jgi:hypothetical protein